MLWRVSFLSLLMTVVADVSTGAIADDATFRLVRSRGEAGDGAVLGYGSAGQFDDQWVTCPTVLRHDGRYWMWYSAQFDAKDRPGGIGLAFSDDGVRWRRAQGGEPVLKPGIDGEQVTSPEVLHDGQRFVMWYTVMPRERHQSGFGYYRIFAAESNDGVTWSRLNGEAPVVDLGPVDAPDAVQAATPSVLLDSDGYRMWYAAWSETAGHTICVAKSADGIHWNRDSKSRPVRGLDPTHAFGPSVCRVKKKYLLLYQSLGAKRGLYAAESSDGENWRMLNANQPVLEPAGGDEFDATLVGHPFAMPDGDRLLVWYTGYKRDLKAGSRHPLRLRIGLARGSISLLLDTAGR